MLATLSNGGSEWMLPCQSWATSSTWCACTVQFAILRSEVGLLWSFRPSTVSLTFPDVLVLGLWGYRLEREGGGHVIPAGVSCHWNTCSPGVFWPGTTFRSYFLCSQRVLWRSIWFYEGFRYLIVPLVSLAVTRGTLTYAAWKSSVYVYISCIYLP